MHIVNLCPTPTFAGGLGKWSVGKVYGEGATATAAPSTVWHGPNTTTSLLVKAALPAAAGWEEGGTQVAIPESASHISIGARLNVLALTGLNEKSGIQVGWAFLDAESKFLKEEGTLAAQTTGVHVVKIAGVAVPAGTASMRLIIDLGSPASEGMSAEWYEDEIQVNEGATLNPYGDGSMRGCRWTGAAWESATAVATGSLQAPARRRQRMNGVTHLRSGKTTVAEAGKAVKLEDEAKAAAPAVSVALEALDTNEGTVVIGDKNVVAAAGTHAAPTRKGVALAAGERIVLDVSDIDIIWIDATTNGDGVSWTLLAA